MKKALIGAGGHAREVMIQMGDIFPCFVDDKYVSEDSLPISLFNPEEYQVLVAIGDSKDRYDVVNSLPKETKYFTFIHPTSIIGNNIHIGTGSFIGAFSILTDNIQIGKHSLLNRSNHIGHDCKIGNYLSMMPGSIISGNCTIGNRSYLGTNSSIRENIKVGNDIVVGLNAGVVKNIEDPGVYIGVPCKKIRNS